MQEMPESSVGQMQTAMIDCINACNRCHNVCSETVFYCLKQGGRHAKSGHLRMLLDCAEICQTSANFMLRGSDQYNLMCEACAEICLRCADDCTRFGDDAAMKRCGQTCSACAQTCQGMVQHFSRTHL